MAQGKIKVGSKKFTKMLDEIHKEATELSMIHGCKVAIVITSKTDDSVIYAFGTPSVESVAQAYLTNSVPVLSESDRRSEENCRELYRQLKEAEMKRRAEKKRAKELGQKSKSRPDGEPKWCEDRAFLMKILEEVAARLKNLQQETSAEADPGTTACASSSSSGHDQDKDSAVAEHDQN